MEADISNAAVAGIAIALETEPQNIMAVIEHPEHDDYLVFYTPERDRPTIRIAEIARALNGTLTVGEDREIPDAFARITQDLQGDQA